MAKQMKGGKKVVRPVGLSQNAKKHAKKGAKRSGKPFMMKGKKVYE